jgi:hypothetical protein
MAKRAAPGAIGSRRRGVGVFGWAVRGAAAGAAGTTARNAVTYRAWAKDPLRTWSGSERG